MRATGRIEIADSSLTIDLGPKLQAYARAGIPQYMVADLVNDCGLIHAEPVGDAYSRVTRLARGVAMQIHAGDGHLLMDVDRLLPRTTAVP